MTANCLSYLLRSFNEKNNEIGCSIRCRFLGVRGWSQGCLPYSSAPDTPRCFLLPCVVRRNTLERSYHDASRAKTEETHETNSPGSAVYHPLPQQPHTKGVNVEKKMRYRMPYKDDNKTTKRGQSSKLKREASKPRGTGR